MQHIKEWQIAAYIDKTLEADEYNVVKEHVDSCEECSFIIKEIATELAVYDSCEDAGTLVSTPKNILKSAYCFNQTPIADIVIDFLETTKERIVSALWEFSDSLQQPTPAFSMRGGGGTSQNSEIALKKKFNKFDIDISISRLQSLNASINLNIIDTTSSEMPEMRVGIFDNSNEIDSVALQNGKAEFNEIAMGDYTIKLWEKSGKKISLSISMKG